MQNYAESIIKGAAQMFQVDYTIDVVGAGKSARNTELAQIVIDAAKTTIWILP